MQEALVGGVGQEYVQSVLSTTDPASAVAQIQRQAGLPDPTTRPLLQLLDQLGRPRCATLPAPPTPSCAPRI